MVSCSMVLDVNRGFFDPSSRTEVSASITSGIFS